ncbi:hypothetical protein F5Y15DRAFT_129348 [Xylariaceae sp. FL0016]|nr:hypothetical protein F5Y15DRAFT_129348 [Xylariaceae sp. FL0016]
MDYETAGYRAEFSNASTNLRTTGEHLENELYDPKHPSRATNSSHPEQAHLHQSCLFRQGVVDECYRGRFWARALEHYLLDNDVRTSTSFRCLMSSCPRGDFKSSEDMLRHLKMCKFFSQGQFYCPMCEDTHEFRTVSKKGCSWNRIKTRHKIQKKIQSFLSPIRWLTGSQSRTQPEPTFCANCSSPILCPLNTQKQELQRFSPITASDSSGVVYSPVAQESFELYVRPGELGGTPVCEVNTCDDVARLEISPPGVTGQSYITTSPSNLSAASRAGYPAFPPIVSPASSTECSELSAGTLPQNQASSDCRAVGNVHAPNAQVLTNWDGFTSHEVIGFNEVQEVRCSMPMPTTISHSMSYCETTSDPIVSQYRPTTLYRENMPSLVLATSQSVPNTSFSDLSQVGWDVGNSNKCRFTAFMAGLPVQSDYVSHPNQMDANDFQITSEAPQTPTLHSEMNAMAISPSATDHSPEISPGSNPKCRYCPFAPRRGIRAYLRKHERSQHGPKQHLPCPEPNCSRYFTRRDNIRQHVRTVHRKILRKIGPKKA